MIEINTTLKIRNDTPQNWNSSNPILMRGEIGCAIDEATGIVALKVGDGVHHWRDLELFPGTREYPVTYIAEREYNALNNTSIKSFGRIYATKELASKAEEYQTKISSLQSSVDEMQEAMEKVQRIARKSGRSTEEAISALKNIYIVPSKEKPVKVIFESAPTVKTIRENKEREKKNPYLEDFEIPHYDFEDMDIEHLIDF